MRRAIPVIVALSLLLLPALVRPPRPEAAVQLLSNGDFEAATTDPWSVLDVSLFSGDPACPPRAGSPGVQAGALTLESPPGYGYVEQTVAVAPGGTYDFSGYFFSPDAPSGSEVRLWVMWLDQAQALVGNAKWLASPPPTSDYQLLTAAGTAEPDAYFARVRIEFALPFPSSTTTLCLDDLGFSGPSPVPTPTPTPTTGATPVPSPTPSSTSVPTSTPSPTQSPSPTPVPIAVGSLLNGGFEEVAADGVPVAWRKFGGALSRSSTHVRSGGYSGAFRSGSETTKWAYQVVGVRPGQAYAFEGYVLPTGPPGSQVYLRVSWYGSADGSGQLLSNVDSLTSLGGGDPSFRYLSTGAVVAPADARSARVRIVLSPASAAPETLYLDDFAFSPRTAAVPDETAVGDASASAPAPQTPASSEPGTAPGRGAPSAGADAIEAEESPYGVKISEVCYDTAQAGDDSAHEWVELYNAGSRSVDLAGWGLVDNTARDSLSDASLEPRAFAVVAAAPDFEADYPAYDGLLILVGDGRIGNGLSNRGDRLILLDADGRPADALSYGDDTEIFDPPIATVAPGHCLERTPAAYDTDTARDFRDSPRPSPGFASEVAGAAATSSATPTGNVSLVRGASGFEGGGGQGGLAWPWILLGGLLFLGGAGAGVVLQRATARVRKRL